jgi:hypothetical protein
MNFIARTGGMISANDPAPYPFNLPERLTKR